MAKMPIRNKSKDNPYTLGFDEEKNIKKLKLIPLKNRFKVPNKKNY